MNEDTRCCGSGTCMINAEGICWCGQHWEDQKMAYKPLAKSDGAEEDDEVQLLPITNGKDF